MNYFLYICISIGAVMGIKGLFKYLAPVEKMQNLRDFAGKRAAIDISAYIYKWASIGISHNIVGAEGQMINHYQGLLYMISQLSAARITPIFIFDGKPPDIKAPTIAARKKRRADAGVQGFGADVWKDCLKLIILLGCAYVKAPEEAEAQAALLVRDGFADFIISEDSDTILFCALFAPTATVMRNPAKPTTIAPTKVLTYLKMNTAQFFNFCLLMGTDYGGKIRGIGPVSAHALAQTLTDDEINAMSGDVIAARTEFAKLHPSAAIIINPRVCKKKVTTMLIGIGLLPARVNSTLDCIYSH